VTRDAFCLVALAALVVIVLYEGSLAQEREKLRQDADAWYRRHERQSAACPGQQYLAQCCENARTDLTCIDGEIRWK
jgi:hypothetical protein